MASVNILKSKKRIVIHGFGRIGRAFFRICSNDPEIEVVAINDFYLTPKEVHYLIKYDSVYGVFPGTVMLVDNHLIVDGKTISLYQNSSIQNIPLENDHIDCLIYATGDLTSLYDELTFLEHCSFYSVLTCHTVDKRVKTFYFGIEDPNTLKSNKIISLSTCDAAAVLPVYKLLARIFGIESASLVTLHPYLGSQNLLDGKPPGDEIELGRSAINSLLPKKTSLESIMKEQCSDDKDKIMVMSYRVPTDSVSNANMHLLLCNEVNREMLQETLSTWCRNACSGFGLYSQEQCVSIDYRCTPYSFIIDHRWINSVKNHARISVWYDNEWGYASRVYDCLKYIFL